MKYILVLVPFLFMGCGSIDRSLANLTGDGSETCHAGVTYLQFTSGTSVMYNTDGTIHTCEDSK